MKTLTNCKKTTLKIAGILLLNSLFVFGQPTSLVNTSDPSFSLLESTNGLGFSTYTCLDKDGDSYGVGPGCLAMDADDRDNTVHSAGEAIAKYNTLTDFLIHLGYNPLRIWYVSKNGDNATGAVNDSTKPFSDWSNASMRTLIAPGDIVLFRAGTWTSMIIDPPSGTAGNPIVFMAYPGETVWIDNSSTGWNSIDLLNQSYIIIDGIKVTGGGNTGSGCMSGGTADVKTTSFSRGDIIRNVEADKCAQGMIFANGLIDFTVEDNLFHDINISGAQHCIYLAARDLVDSNVIIRRNICYKADWNGFHLNGRFENMQIDQNLIYSVGIGGISLQNGTSNSLIRNNLIFNTASAGIDMDNYPGNCSKFGQGGTDNICPYDQINNLFENNTIYQTGFDVTQGGSISTKPAVVVANNTIGKVGDLGHHTFRNNIFVGYGGTGNYHYPSVVFYDTNKTYLSTSTFTNNIFWSLEGASAEVIGFGFASLPSYGFIGYTLAQAAAITTINNCINADPKFIAAKPSFWNSTDSFNLKLQSSSPAITAGTTIGAPAYDLIGNTRTMPPTIGAYEYIDPLSVKKISHPEKINWVTVLINNDNVDFIFLNADEKNICIYDVTGKMIYCENKLTSNKLSLSRSFFAPGIYVTQSTINNEVVGQKFIIR